MAHNWTPNQLQAINKIGSNILVAAAARKWKNNSSNIKGHAFVKRHNFGTSWAGLFDI